MIISPNPEHKFANCSPRFPLSICKFKSPPKITERPFSYAPCSALWNCSKKLLRSCFEYPACGGNDSIFLLANVNIYVQYLFRQNNLPFCPFLVPSMHQNSHTCYTCCPNQSIHGIENHHQVRPGQLARPDGSPVLGHKQLYTKVSE